MTQIAPLPPGSVVGIIGGGQLGRMLCQAALKLGLQTHTYSPDDPCPAKEVSTHFTRGDYEDINTLETFANSCDAVTFEFENIPHDSVKTIEAGAGGLFPPPKALKVSQDRLDEKQFLRKLGIETAPFMPVAGPDAIEMAIGMVGLPAILKTRRLGYDGKGQFRITSEDQCTAGWMRIGQKPSIVEGMVNFKCELSAIVAVSANTSVAFDIAENVHHDGILRTSTVPTSTARPDIREDAQKIALKIADALDYRGVLTVEFFLTEDNRLVVNEIAPRVHNSGHWTVEACGMSQFEAHIRAICNWPMGSTIRYANVVMENIIGDEADDWEAYISDPTAALTLYGKKEARAGRKMGHVTHLNPRKPD